MSRVEGSKSSVESKMSSVESKMSRVKSRGSNFPKCFFRTCTLSSSAVCRVKFAGKKLLQNFTLKRLLKNCTLNCVN